MGRVCGFVRHGKKLVECYECGPLNQGYATEIDCSQRHVQAERFRDEPFMNNVG